MNLLEVYDLSYNKLCVLNDYSQYCASKIEENLKLNTINTLNFQMPIDSPKIKYIKNENLVKWKGEYYFIKNPRLSHSLSDKTMTVECMHLSCGLEGILCGELNLIGQNASTLITNVLASTPTGWTKGVINVDSSINRSLVVKEQSVFTNLLKIAELFNAQLTFNSATRTIDMTTAKTDRNIQIRKGKNLQSVDIESDTSELVTRLFAFGGDDVNTGLEINIMSVNPTGKSYIEDYSYYTAQGYTTSYISSHPELFLRAMTWNDTQYLDSTSLYNDAIDKLNTLCKPKVKCTIQGVDLSLFPEYFTCSPILGEVVYVIDEDLGLSLQAQVVEISTNSDEPLALKISVSNEIVYNSILRQMVSTTTSLTKIVKSDNTIRGGYIEDNSIGKNQISWTPTASEVGARPSTWTPTASEVGALGTNWVGTTYVDSKGVYTGSLVANQIKSGTIDANVVTVTNLVVGTNVTMGANAKISWSNVTSQPTIPKYASDVGALATNWVGTTYIDAYGLYTGTISANQINAGSLNAMYIKGGTLTLGGISNTNGVLSLLNSSSSEVIRLDNSGISFHSGTIKFLSASNSNKYAYINYLQDSTEYSIWNTSGASGGAVVLGIVGNGIGINYDVLVLKTPARIIAQSTGITFRDYANTVSFDIIQSQVESAIVPSINTGYGTVQIGAGNASYAHIYTDRPQFMFNKGIYLNNGSDLFINAAINGYSGTNIYNDLGYLEFTTAIKATNVAYNSDRNLKSEIELYDEELAFNQLKETPIYKYTYTGLEYDGYTLGIMVDQAPLDITFQNDLKSINQYSYTSWLMSALKTEIAKREQLQQDFEQFKINMVGGV